MIARKTNELIASGITDKDEIAEIVLDYMKQPSQIKSVSPFQPIFIMSFEG